MPRARSVGRAAIGLGSNEGEPKARVTAALEALGRLGRVVARSSFYTSPAWGVRDQPDFVNAAAIVETSLRPRDLLAALKALETELGRVVTFRWGPRAIDLDILAYDDLTIHEPDLVVPHERLHERAFALAPLAEIDPTYAPLFAALAPAERATVQRIPDEPARTARAVTWDETLERVRSAADFCASAGLVRFRIEEETISVDVRRSARPIATPVAVVHEGDTAAAGVGHTATNGATHATQLRVLKAEFVGIVRLSRPAVAVGAELVADRELAYVESLGIRNPVRSGGTGRVSDVFISDGDAVEYGQALFALET